MILNAGDVVRVEYSHGKYYTGQVLWTERHVNMDWVTVKPDDERMIFTFGSSRDMENRYKSYIYNHPVLGCVEKV